MEQTPFTGSEPQLQPPLTPQSSLWSRMFNVFATPGDVFLEVKQSAPNLWNWVAPAILLVFVGWIGSALVFSQESIRHQLDEMTSRAIDKQLERAHMPEAQAAQARAMGEKYGSIGVKVSAYGGPVVAGFGMPLIWALIIWLVGAKAMKGDFSFLKALEVAGLAVMITVLDAVIRTLLILVTGNIFAAPGLALLVKEYDPQNPVHMAMAVVNIMTFWSLSVRSIGLARLAGASIWRAAAWIFGLWIAYTGVMLGFSFAAQRIFAH